ncbi:MAG TPA: polysaccharide deacetylase family protein [Solirubrobacteraceae bacterium]|jgi:peptidoglycan/xylan/chitin deacetylase (PgdA/CDA1 family)|nr:polysaccharide deacetylase family protein [Solirubrobacteraceae bacterium]
MILCYHALSPDWSADLATTPERFESQLALLARRGYEGMRFTDAVRAPARRRIVAITFDDAYRSVLTLARPILDRFGFPATVFVPTNGVESGGALRWPGIDQWIGGPHEHELTPMSWEELRSLASAGWEIGSHTASHPHLTRLDDAALADELGRSREVCEERLARPCGSIAYPYGDVDDRVVAATARAGYDVAAALPRRLNPRGPLRTPRIGVFQIDDDRRFRMKISPAMRRLRSSPLWDALDRLRVVAPLA